MLPLTVCLSVSGSLKVQIEKKEDHMGILILPWSAAEVQRVYGAVNNLLLKILYRWNGDIKYIIYA